MSSIPRRRGALVYKFLRQDGLRFVVYNASALTIPAEHEKGQWYARPYPMSPWIEPFGPFPSADLAERSLDASESFASGQFCRV